MSSLARLDRLAQRIDRLSAAVGRGAAWCLLFMVLAKFAVVLMRYVLGVGSVWLQESILYTHGAVFMLAAAWTLAVDAHVRVDIFYAEASARTKALIDLLGALLLLLPFALAVLVLSSPYVARSWAILEGSRETSGLPALFLLKTLIPLFAALLGLQGIAQIIRAGIAIAGAPSGRR
ncbi:MAG TPA: TRAP transporter small permease subunit [Xanthobacteraceae bacterium]|nr:TRAP transporter small permease subunit [Xanthobacteraceae bacterium]